MAHRGSRGIALLFLDHGTRRGWGVSVTPWSLFTLGKDPVPIVQEAEWATGPVWTGVENLAPTRIRSPDRPARRQSLYRLHYLADVFHKPHAKIKIPTSAGWRLRKSIEMVVHFLYVLYMTCCIQWHHYSKVISVDILHKAYHLNFLAVLLLFLYNSYEIIHFRKSSSHWHMIQ